MKIFGGEHTFLCKAVCGNLPCDRRLNAANLSAPGVTSAYVIDHSADCGDWSPPVEFDVSVEFGGWGPAISEPTRQRIERGMQALAMAGYRQCR